MHEKTNSHYRPTLYQPNILAATASTLSLEIQKGQQILLSRSQLDMAQAGDEGCPFFRGL